jgi:hypothetical protein
LYPRAFNLALNVPFAFFFLAQDIAPLWDIYTFGCLEDIVLQESFLFFFDTDYPIAFVLPMHRHAVFHYVELLCISKSASYASTNTGYFRGVLATSFTVA